MSLMTPWKDLSGTNYVLRKKMGEITKFIIIKIICIMQRKKSAHCLS